MLSVFSPIGPPELPEDPFRDTLFLPLAPLITCISPTLSNFDLFHVFLAIMAAAVASTTHKPTDGCIREVFDSHMYVAGCSDLTLTLSWPH